MNAKMILGTILAVFGIGAAFIGVSDVGAAAVDSVLGIDYGHLCLWLCGILIVGAICCIAMAIYTKLYGDF